MIERIVGWFKRVFFKSSAEAEAVNAEELQQGYVPPDPQRASETREAKRDLFDTLRRFALKAEDDDLLEYAERRKAALQRLEDEYNVVTRGGDE